MSDAGVIDSSGHRAGLQCARRLWLAARAPELGEGSSLAAERAARLRARRELCELAAALFPGARAVAEQDTAAAVARTQALRADASVARIREAAFAAEGAVARVDFVERIDAARWGLRFVRAALRPNEAMLDDLAFATHVARASGLEVASVELVLLDGDFVRGAGEPEARALLRRSDVTNEVLYLAGDLAARLRAQRQILAEARAPQVEPSPHCRRPDACEFIAHCVADKRPDWIGFLPGLRDGAFQQLHAGGIERMADLPDALARTPAQRNARASAACGAVHVARDLARRLDGFGPPADCLDFEAILPEIPVFAGTRPFEVVPFQWSAHLHREQGEPAHVEFLADGRGDPRRAFAESLVEAFAGRTLPILVYSSFEDDVLAALARACADLAEPLERLRARLRDLLPVLRRAVYHPAFLGSFALKRVAPVLCPGFGFADLSGIADGGAASRAWLALARGELAPERGAQVLDELRRYCARDSLALARLLPALRALEPERAHSVR
jgi:predicted RecB family nuclease